MAPDAFAQIGRQGLIFMQVQAAKLTVGRLLVTKAGFCARHDALLTWPQCISMPADPAFLPGWVSHNQCVIGHVFGNHSTCGDKGITTDGYSTHYLFIGTYGGTAFDDCYLVKMVPVYLRARVGDIGEYAGRSEENIILNHQTGIN